MSVFPRSNLNSVPLESEVNLSALVTDKAHQVAYFLFFRALAEWSSECKSAVLIKSFPIFTQVRSGPIHRWPVVRRVSVSLRHMFLLSFVRRRSKSHYSDTMLHIESRSPCWISTHVFLFHAVPKRGQRYTWQAPCFVRQLKPFPKVRRNRVEWKHSAEKYHDQTMKFTHPAEGLTPFSLWVCLHHTYAARNLILRCLTGSHRVTVLTKSNYRVRLNVNMNIADSISFHFNFGKGHLRLRQSAIFLNEES